jgi:2-amino-4-hydroxy-6-hydroxymethyldihydropteridine diphosphokinase
MIRCFISLGSNLAEPRQQIHTAVTTLTTAPSIHFERLSPLYANPALGPGAQPDYVNAVAELSTSLDPFALLQTLQTIENNQGRVRAERWAARTLDLDLLLYGMETITTSTLVVPHPQMHGRNFVLYPLADIAPDLVLPDGTPLRALLDCCPGHGLRQL